MLDVVAGLAYIEVLADTHDRGEPVPERRSGFGGYQCIVLMVVGAPLGVADDGEGAAQLGQERTTDLAGVRAGIVLRQILRTVGEPQPVTVDQRLYAAQVGERRDDRDVDLVEVLVRKREGDLLHQCDGLEMIEVHLPVAGDQRFTGQDCLLVEDVDAGQGLALKVFQ